MKVVIEELGDRRLVFTASSIDGAVVNALRRVVIAEVPYVAATAAETTFFENTGVLHNHFIADRVEMIPIHLTRVEVDAYIPSSIKVHLDVRNDGKLPRDVTSGDFTVTLHDRPHPEAARLYPTSDDGDHVLLTVLKPGERLRLESVVTKGVGHARYASVSTCAFSPVLDPALVAERAAAAVTDREKNRFEHIDRKRCWRPGPDGNAREFRFILEAESGLSPREVVESAMSVLLRKCTTAEPVVIDSSTGADGVVITVVEVAGEGHTLGNLLQSGAVDELLEDGAPLKYVGYVCPHPLEKRVHFKVVADGDPLASFEAMRRVAVERLTELQHLLSEEFARDLGSP